MIIVCWTQGVDLRMSPMQDHYETFETLWLAQQRYKELIDLDDTYSASICGVIESTDYEPHDWQFPPA